jgi:hypothetical protein
MTAHLSLAEQVEATRKARGRLAESVSRFSPEHLAILREAARPLRVYGITGNLSSLQEFLEGAKEIWKRWLSRRRRAGTMTWPDYFSIIQRKVLTPNDFAKLEASRVRLALYEELSKRTPKPLAWKFTRQDMLNWLKRASPHFLAAPAA